MKVKYETVKQTLRNEIIDGKYKINEKLPTESELMKRFDVSRYTIRRAVDDLENEHYIYRIQGGGMFVQDWQRDWSTPEKIRSLESLVPIWQTTFFHQLFRESIVLSLIRVTH